MVLLFAGAVYDSNTGPKTFKYAAPLIEKATGHQGWGWNNIYMEHAGELLRWSDIRSRVEQRRAAAAAAATGASSEAIGIEQD